MVSTFDTANLTYPEPSDSGLNSTQSTAAKMDDTVVDTFFVDRWIWGIMQGRVYARKITSIDELKQRISDEWDKIDQQLIDYAIKQWRKHLVATVSARGGHIKHML